MQLCLKLEDLAVILVGLRKRTLQSLFLIHQIVDGTALSVFVKQGFHFVGDLRRRALGTDLLGAREEDVLDGFLYGILVDARIADRADESGVEEQVATHTEGQASLATNHCNHSSNRCNYKP